MSKKIFVLLIALIFFSSIIYFSFKDIKIIKKKKEENLIELEADIEEPKLEVYDKEEYVYNESKEKVENVIENKQENVDELIIGRIKIDKIGLDAPIKEGSSDEILENYVGHIEGTDLFDGNVGLAAHNRGATKNYFENLSRLENGDEIVYETKQGVRRYIVYKTMEILDTDWSNFETSLENELTLITCINNKVNLRLCVKAKEDK